MKLLCITSYYKPAYIYGGPSRSVPSLCEALVKNGVDLTVFTTNANGHNKFLKIPTDHSVTVDGVEVYYFPLTKYVSNIIPFYSQKLLHTCFEMMDRFDIIYIVGNWTHPVFAGASIAINKKIPYVISPRGSLMKWSMAEKALKKRIYLSLIERRLINHASAIHVSSSLEKTQLNKWNFTPTVYSIPNGIDINTYENLPQKGELRTSLGILPSGTLSLFVGRLHKEKRLDLIIQSFAIVAKQSFDAHLLIVGADQDGSGKAAIEQVNKLELNNRVHFAGHLSGLDLIQAYINADVFILLSHRESFGMVAVEAMTNGLPLVLAEEVGIAVEVEQAQAGIKVQADPTTVGKAWIKLLENPILRNEMGKRGRKLVQERFTSNEVAVQMENLFSMIISKK